MNHTRFFYCALIASMFTVATFSASAQSAVTPVTPAMADADAQAQTSAAGNADADVRDVADMTAEVDRFCPYTGSRIVAQDKSGKRCSTFGRVYTHDDIQRTGAVDLADALRKLDPAIR
ncbi:MAG: hypothetical protein LH470_07885 [Lysobacter sp.]|nr:hypothetical protein [Lysobacter sp.]